MNRDRAVRDLQWHTCYVEWTCFCGEEQIAERGKAICKKCGLVRGSRMSKHIYEEEQDNMDDQSFSNWAKSLDKAWISGLRWGCFWGMLITIVAGFIVAWFANPT